MPNIAAPPSSDKLAHEQAADEIRRRLRNRNLRAPGHRRLTTLLSYHLAMAAHYSSVEAA